MTGKLPWSMSATLVGGPNNPDPIDDPMNVVFSENERGPYRLLFRKCCPCMCINGAGDNYTARLGQAVEFICGCGAHPSVMVCDGEVVGTSA